MNEKDKNPEAPSTPEQAQQVVDEITRITDDVETRRITGSHVGRFGKPFKFRRHNGMLFNIYPEGQENINDDTITDLAKVTIYNDDGSQTSYTSELTPVGMQLTKHIVVPPTRGEWYGSPEDGADDMLRIVNGAILAHKARKDERELGLNLVSGAEADGLIATLQATATASQNQTH